MSNTRKAKDLLGKGKPPEKTVSVYLRADLVSQIQQAERDLVAAREGWQRTKMDEPDPAQDYAKKIEALREEMRESEVVFTFRGITRKQRSDLLAAHPSEKPGELSNVDTFFPALIHACSVDPEFGSPDEAAQFCSEIGSAQSDMLWDAAWSLTQDAVSVPFSVAASLLTQDSEQK